MILKFYKRTCISLFRVNCVTLGDRYYATLDWLALYLEFGNVIFNNWHRISGYHVDQIQSDGWRLSPEVFSKCAYFKKSVKFYPICQK